MTTPILHRECDHVTFSLQQTCLSKANLWVCQGWDYRRLAGTQLESILMKYQNSGKGRNICKNSYDWDIDPLSKARIGNKKYAEANRPV